MTYDGDHTQRKMMGIESQGMILSALNFDGSLSVTTTLGEVKPSSQVGYVIALTHI